MNTVNLWPLFSAILFMTVTFFACKPGGFIDQIRDWRHGRAVDQTDDWEAFNKAFEADK